MHALKEIKNISLKGLALFFLAETKEFSLEKFADIFNKDIDASKTEVDYTKLIEETKEKLSNKESEESIFKKRFESHARYLQFLESSNKVLGVLSHKLEKSKLKRVDKKEKFKLKQQMNSKKGEDHLQPSLLTAEEKQEKAEEKAKRTEEFRALKVASIQKKYEKLHSQTEKNKSHKERTEFKKTGKERKQQLRQEKLEKRQATEAAFVPRQPIGNFKTENMKNIDQLHPSWAARLQQQQQQSSTLSAFKGTIKML